MSIIVYTFQTIVWTCMETGAFTMFATLIKNLRKIAFRCYNGLYFILLFLGLQCPYIFYALSIITMYKFVQGQFN